MSSKLPTIKKVNLNLNLKINLEKKPEIKTPIRNIKNKNLFEQKSHNNNFKRIINSSNEYFKKTKRIELTNLFCYNPNLKIKSYNAPKKREKIFNRALLKSASVNSYPHNSILERLSNEKLGKIDKYISSQKIDNRKIFQNLKEISYNPNKSNSLIFVKNDKIKNKTLYDGNRRIFNESFNLNSSKDTNAIIINSELNDQDKYEKYIIEKFIKNREIKNNILINDNILNKKRIIYIILDGSIIINEKNIKAYSLQIPTVDEMNLLNKEKRNILKYQIIRKSQKFFNCSKPITTIFSPEKEIINDIIEIKKEFKFLYVSQNIFCKGVSLVSTPSFWKIYKKEFKSQLFEEILNKKEQNCHFDKLVNKKNNYNFYLKKKEIIRGIKPKFEIYKPHYSFADGENDLEHENFIVYSDNEERKSSKEKKIMNHCYLKNDFFLYLNERSTNKQISKLEKKLKYNKIFDIRKSYEKCKFNYDEIIERYKKEIQKELKINPKIYNISTIDSKISSHNLQHPKDKITKLYLNRNKSHKSFIREKMFEDSIYNGIDRKITKYYTPLILYNIPKLLSEYKNITRRKLYEIYTKYKDLVSLSYAKNKTDFILESGVDFHTFWFCVEQFSNEEEKFVKKIYNQINRSKLCVLNMKDFLRGMYFIQNSELTEKLDLFLKALDFSGKGSINFTEAVKICKSSIKRNLTDKKEESSDNVYALNELSLFFTNFIFKLIGVDKDKELKIDDLKKAILQKKDELNKLEYLEMFCGAN